jgi:hypothetical protein
MGDPHVVLPPSPERLAWEKEQGVVCPTIPQLTEDGIDEQIKDKPSGVNEVSLPLLRSDGTKITEIEAGIVFNTEGDGTYPVYVLLGPDGLPAATIVVFQKQASDHLPSAIQALLESEEFEEFDEEVE